MPVHIDHVVTELIAEPESNAVGEASDKRWQEQMQAEAFMKQIERYYRRLSAESFDD